MFFKSMHKKKSAHRRDEMERDKDGPAGYEGKEHVKYKDPGYTREKIKFPEDEPHMKSHVGKEEMHEMEDNYHMDVPDQTYDTLPKKIPRASMIMDEPMEPKPLIGNLVETSGKKGLKDEDGEENYGPNENQENDVKGQTFSSKDQRKKLAVSMIKRRMHN